MHPLIRKSIRFDALKRKTNGSSVYDMHALIRKAFDALKRRANARVSITHYALGPRVVVTEKVRLFGEGAQTNKNYQNNKRRLSTKISKHH